MFKKVAKGNSELKYILLFLSGITLIVLLILLFNRTMLNLQTNQTTLNLSPTPVALQENEVQSINSFFARRSLDINSEENGSDISTLFNKVSNEFKETDLIQEKNSDNTCEIDGQPVNEGVVIYDTTCSAK